MTEVCGAVINSNLGLGKSIVPGQVTPDAFVADKYTQATMDRLVE